MIDDPAVITCAISGVIANRDQCPAIPYTPEEYGQEARRAVEEGASMIHIHARRPDGSPSYEVEDFLAITEAIRQEAGDVIVNYSTGTIGVPVEKRVAYLRAGLPEVAALNMGSMNYAKYSKSRRAFVFDMVFPNPFSEIVQLLTAMSELEIRPEHECFDVGHVGSLPPLLHMGVLKAPLHVDCIMGVIGGIPASARNLATMVENIPGLNGYDEGGQPASGLHGYAEGGQPASGLHGDAEGGQPVPGLHGDTEGGELHGGGQPASGLHGDAGRAQRSHWGVIGISREQWMLVAAALTLGGSVRVGLEDNLYLPNGEMARSNGDLIAKARQMAQDVGRRPASVAEARALLGVTARVTTSKQAR